MAEPYRIYRVRKGIPRPMSEWTTREAAWGAAYDLAGDMSGQECFTGENYLRGANGLFAVLPYQIAPTDSGGNA